MKNLNEKDRSGCSENRLLLSRRSMLGISAGLFTSAFLPRIAYANTNSDARLLVVILRGGLDGINMLIPSFDPHYEAARQGLAIEAGDALPLSDGFRLHPAMPFLHQLYAQGEAAFVPAAGLAVQNKSHFECQENLENGLPGNSATATGWVNRLMNALPNGDPIRAGKAIGVSETPRILRGPEPVLSWSSTWFNRASGALVASLDDLYRRYDTELEQALSLGLEADRLAGGQGAEEDPNITPLLLGFRGAARLLSMEIGPRVAVLSVDGWDTHLNQGGLNGIFANRLDLLDEGIATYRQVMGQKWRDTVVCCITEFGRTVQMNGTRGTDHGIAMPVVLAGGAIRSGFYSDWPGLSTAQLYEGVDLRPTIDVRSVFKGILRDHIGVPLDLLDGTVFPESNHERALESLIASPVRTANIGPDGGTSASAIRQSPIARYRLQNGST